MSENKSRKKPLKALTTEERMKLRAMTPEERCKWYDEDTDYDWECLRMLTRDVLRFDGPFGLLWLLFEDEGGERTPWMTTALGLATIIVSVVALLRTQ